MIRVRLRICVSILVAISCQQARADEPTTLQGKTLEGWVAALRDKTGRDRRAADIALGYFGPAAGVAVPDLIDAVRHGPLKEEAIEALVRIGQGAEVTVPILIERFLAEGCQHLTGMGFFGGFGRAKNMLVRIGGPAVSALIGVLNGPNADMRMCAAEALGAIGPAARLAVPSLIRAVDPDNPPWNPALQVYAVRALGAIGPDAKPAVPILNNLLDKDWNSDAITLFKELAEALDRLGAPPVVKLLKFFLHDEDSFAAHELSLLGPKAKSAVPLLRQALKDERIRIRIDAAASLAFIDPPARDAVPVLIEAIDHPNEEIDYKPVLSALGRLGPEARAAIPALITVTAKKPEMYSLSEVIASQVANVRGNGRSDWWKKLDSNAWLSQLASSSRTIAWFKWWASRGAKLHNRPYFNHRHRNSTGINSDACGGKGSMSKRPRDSSTNDRIGPPLCMVPPSQMTITGSGSPRTAPLRNSATSTLLK